MKAGNSNRLPAVAEKKPLTMVLRTLPTGHDRHHCLIAVLFDGDYCKPVESHVWHWTTENSGDVRTVICNTVASKSTGLTYMMAGRIYMAIRKLSKANGGQL